MSLFLLGPSGGMGGYIKIRGITNNVRAHLENRNIAEMILRIWQYVDHAACGIYHTGTKSGLIVQHNSTLDVGNYGIAVTAANPQTNANAYLFYVLADNAANTADVVKIKSSSSGTCVEIEQNFSDGTALLIDNNYTGMGIEINQGAILAASKYALYVYSNSDQDASPLSYMHLDNAGSTTEVLKLVHDAAAASTPYIQTWYQGANIRAYIAVNGDFGYDGGLDNFSHIDDIDALRTIQPDAENPHLLDKSSLPEDTLRNNGMVKIGAMQGYMLCTMQELLKRIEQLEEYIYGQKGS